MTSKNVFVDTSFFKALSDINDDFHDDSVNILEKTKPGEIEFITTNFILDETFTLIRTKCGYEDSIEFHDGLSKNFEGLSIVRVELDDEILAWEYFLNPWSKLSFTDCTCFAVMKRLGLEYAATFDNHFAKAGFKVFK